MTSAKQLIQVFVYGTLKKGEPNHFWLTKKENGFAQFISGGKTDIKFPLIIATKYNIPFLLNVPGTGQNVSGEIYSVDETMLKNLDELEDYPDLYDRTIFNVNGSDGYVQSFFYFHILVFSFVRVTFKTCVTICQNFYSKSCMCRPRFMLDGESSHRKFTLFFYRFS